MGLWQTTDQIEAGLANLKSKTSRLKALETQLDFRKKVLQQTHPNKVIFQFSHQGRHFTVDNLSQTKNRQGDREVQLLVRATLQEDKFSTGGLWKGKVSGF